MLALGGYSHAQQHFEAVAAVLLERCSSGCQLTFNDSYWGPSDKGNDLILPEKKIRLRWKN